MSETVLLTEEQVTRLKRVLHNLAMGQKRHPDTAEAMRLLGGLLRMCARCGQRPVLGGPEDLTCCDRCATQVGHGLGYEEALYEAAEEVREIRSGYPNNPQIRSLASIRGWLRDRAARTAA